MNESDWLRHLLPLPRQVAVPASVHCRRDAVRIVVAGAPHEALSEAESVLRQALDAGAAGPSGLTIRLGRVEDLDAVDAGVLDTARHRNQAYVITCPSQDQICIGGGSVVGAFYGAVTLAQLLSATTDADSLEVPLPEIVDGPEIEERGLWNFPDMDEWIPWLSGLKLNYGKMADTSLAPVERDTPGRAGVDADLMQRARHRGFHYVPYILHLNFLHGVGLFSAYPELAGKGDAALAGRYFAHKQGDQHRAPCASQPRLVDLLTDWMTSIASQGGLEISCWLSERPCQCQCERCTPVGQFVLETRAFLEAWERARESFPELLIRIFSSTTTPEQDDQVLAELPSEVRFERACATSMERCRHQPRDLFANALIDEAATGGRWVASYDVPIGAYGNVDTPEFKVPQFSAQRIQDFVGQLARRRYAGAYGMLAWSPKAREICGFSISALAEYAWNPKGRSAADFAAAWATREGLSDPARVGSWAEQLGEIEFDVYDSDFPMCWSWGHAVEMIEKDHAPRLGEGMFRHFHDESDFESKARACEAAEQLVDGIERRDLALATRVVGSYVRLLQAVWHLSRANAYADAESAAGQQQLAAMMDSLETAGDDNVGAIRAWRAELGPEPWGYRVHDAIDATGDTVQRIARHVRDRRLY